jgi:transposase-like protein
LQGIECEKLLSGKDADSLIGRQVLINAATHQLIVTSFRRNPECRFDHATWDISRLGRTPQELTLGTMLESAGRSQAIAAIAFGGSTLVKRLDCPRCGFSRRVFRLQSRLREQDQVCDRCGRPMLAAGFYSKSRLARADLGPGEAARTLASLGLRAGDVISLRTGADEKFFELGAGISASRQSSKLKHRRHS